jgi:uncharacterized cupredoxin-like copper-binding protein
MLSRRRVVVAGVALLAAFPGGLALRAGDGPRVVELRMRYSSFAPARFDASPGETVRIVVRNDDPIDHEFILGDDEVQRVHEAGTEAHHPPRPGEMSVPAGTTRVTTYTFEETGSLIFGCHVPGHYAYGMRGRVMVS